MTKSPPSSLLPYPHPSPPQPHPSHPKSIQTALFITNSTFFTTCCHFKTKRCFRKIFRRADGGHIGNKWWPPWKRHTIFISLHLYCVYSNAYYPILRFFLSVVIFTTENMHLNRQSQCWLYTTGKKYGIFFISAIFFYFMGRIGYFFIWFTFLQADIIFGELIHTQYQNEPQRFKNNYFGPFSLLDAG